MYFDTTYTNGVIAVKEKSLLKDKVLRLCELGIDEAFRTLLDSGFGGGATDNVYEYEKLLQAETSLLETFMQTYAPSEAEKRYFLLPKDFHNAKALFKARILGEPADGMLVSQGFIEIELLKSCIDGCNYEALTSIPALAKACKACEESLETDASGITIGSIFEKALYEELLLSVKKQRGLKSLLTAKIDMTNVLTALRCGDETVAKTQYLKGGKIGEKKLQALFALDTDGIRRAFADTEYKTFIALCMTAKEKKLPYVEAEKFRDGYDLWTLEQRKFDLVKNEPFLYYVFRKKAEIANVRIVFACKLAGLDEQQIKNRLRK